MQNCAANAINLHLARPSCIPGAVIMTGMQTRAAGLPFPIAELLGQRPSQTILAVHSRQDDPWLGRNASAYENLHRSLEERQADINKLLPARAPSANLQHHFDFALRKKMKRSTLQADPSCLRNKSAAGSPFPWNSCAPFKSSGQPPSGELFGSGPMLSGMGRRSTLSRFFNASRHSLHNPSKLKPGMFTLVNYAPRDLW